MSSSDNNLSDLNFNIEGETSSLDIYVVKSSWNDKITNRLLSGCLEGLEKMGIPTDQIKVVEVPGSFELPLGAQMVIDASDPKPNAVICLGCVIRGETSHFEYVSQSVSQGIKDVGLKYNLPVVFGVLTDDNIQQSLSRSGGELGNKGEEAAVTAAKMAILQRDIRR